MNPGRTLLAAGIVLAAWAWIAKAGDENSPDKSARADGIETATFSMYCYWTGEATLGKVDGIVASRIGSWQGREIVQVDYDASKTDIEELARALKRRNSFYSFVTSDPAERDAAAEVLGKDEVVLFDGNPRFIESKHSLRVAKPQVYALDLTEAQAIQLNSWAHFGGPMPDVLTEEQLAKVGPETP